MNRFAVSSALVWCLLATSISACSSDSKSSAGTGGQGGQGAQGGQGGATGDVSPHTLSYDDPNIQYSGRILFSAGKAPRFSAPGVNLTVRFKGVGASMIVVDSAPSNSANYFEVVVDGDYDHGTKQKPDDSGIVPLVQDLPYGEHVLNIVKRTEASTGSVDFRSITVLGEPLAPPEKPAHKIEIIGDSISVGSGNEAADGSADCMMDYGRPFSNASKAYGPRIARTLGAEYHVTAVSGIGALRNYQCGDANVAPDPNAMPQVYDRTLIERADSPKWDTSLFVPDAVLMMIGTNDFSPDSCNKPALNETVDPTNYAAFIQVLGDFVTKLEGYYPDAEIFLTSSPMLHDGWPDATYTSDTSQRAAISSVAENVNTAQGNDKVHVILAAYDKTRYAGRGCGTHPNAYEHGIIAGLDASKPSDPLPPALILNPMKAVLGW